MTWVGDSYAEQALQGTFYGHIQQTEKIMTESLGLRFTEAWTIWCAEDTNVRRDDRLTDTVTGYVYVVRFIKELILPKPSADNAHLQVIVERYLPEDV